MRHTFFRRGMVAVLGALLAAGCASQGSDLPNLPPAPSLAQSYVLGPGDRLQITIFGMDEPANQNAPNQNQFTVSDSGMVGAPLVGQIKAAGLTIAQLQDSLTTKLSEGYIKNPKVGIEVETYRNFSILGEVQHPGAFPYTPNATVLTAVATGGGYTYRANESYAVVSRELNGKSITGKADPTTPIQPGDIIRIPERYF
jgi:polysaccharide biosynthesis/export protein